MCFVFLPENSAIEKKGWGVEADDEKTDEEERTRDAGPRRAIADTV